MLDLSLVKVVIKVFYLGTDQGLGLGVYGLGTELG